MVVPIRPRTFEIGYADPVDFVSNCAAASSDQNSGPAVKKSFFFFIREKIDVQFTLKLFKVNCKKSAQRFILQFVIL